MELKQLSVEDCLKAVYTSKKITSDIENFVYSEVESVLSEYLDGFTWSCVDFSFGIYNQNYLHVRDAEMFFEQAERMTGYADEEGLKSIFYDVMRMIAIEKFGKIPTTHSRTELVWADGEVSCCASDKFDYEVFNGYSMGICEKNNRVLLFKDRDDEERKVYFVEYAN